MDQVSCKLHQLLFLVLLSVIEVPKGHATNRNSALPTDDAKDPSKASSPDWLASLKGLPSVEECGNSKVNLTDKIVGGYPAELGAWPWMAALGVKDWASDSAVEFGCGGTLISKRHILTAAHCLNDSMVITPFNFVRLGELNLDPNVADGASPVDYKIAEKIFHPRDNSHWPFHDIAIIRLEKDVTFTDLIRPICLPFAPEIRNNTWVDYSTYVAGWGFTTDGGNQSDALLQVQVPVWDTEKCKSAYPGDPSVDDLVICAGLDEGGKSSCHGDSGGPMMISHNSKIYQIGIVSWGEGCAKPKLPGVYTRVSSYLEWIAKNVE